MRYSIIQKSRYFILIGFFLLINMACSEITPEPETGGEIAVQFSAGIQSRAIDTDWSPMDSIGISMLEPGSTTVVNNTFNRRYNTDNTGSGRFQPAAPDQTIYFPSDGTAVEFKAYYPYRDAPGGSFLIPVDVSDQSNLPAIDLMTAEHISGFSRTDPNATLHFHHRLTKVIFNIDLQNSTQQEADLHECEFLIEGFNTTATYNLLTETLAQPAAPAKIELPASGTDYLQRTAIVLPREAAAGAEITLRLTSGGFYKANLSDKLELKAGYKYLIKILISESVLQLEVVNIEPWSDGGEHQLEAN